jgi:hypothetical protein
MLFQPESIKIKAYINVYMYTRFQVQGLLGMLAQGTLVLLEAYTHVW